MSELMQKPVFEDRASLTVSVDREGVCCSTRGVVSLYRHLQRSACPGSSDYFVAVDRVHKDVAIAMEENGWDDFAR